MTAVASAPVSRGGTGQEQVRTNSDLNSPSLKNQSPSQLSPEERMMNLLGRKKAIKEIKNTKLVIRRLPFDVTMDELTQFLSPLPDHSYFYITRGDSDFSREDTLFSRAYVNLSRQEDAVSFFQKLDGFPLKSSGRIYRPVVEFAPFHRVPKRSAVKSDSKEGTIDSDQDYNAFLKSLEENNSKQPPVAEERIETEKSKDNHHTTTPLIQHLIQKHEQKQLRSGGGRGGSGYTSEPKIIKKRNTGPTKDSDFSTYSTDRKTFRGPSASSRGPISCENSQKQQSSKAGPVIIVTDKSYGSKKGLLSHTDTDRSHAPYDNYPKSAQNSGKEYSNKHSKSNPNHSVSYYDSSGRGGYSASSSSHSRRSNKKSGKGGNKYNSDYPSGYNSCPGDWGYEDKGGYERRGRYDEWYPPGDGRGPKRREDRGRNVDWDSQRHYSPRGDRHY